jgi:UDP-glucuronate 4-epimerase
MAMPEHAVIVTGAAGFIGSHLAGALIARGRSVLGIDNFDPAYSRQSKRQNIDRVRASTTGTASLFELVEADVCDRDRMSAVFAQHRPGTLFHVAALAGVRRSIEDPARYAAVNVDGLISVLDAARAAGCRTIIFASSSSVYGNNPKVPFAETDSVEQPISPYAATKRAGELICHAYAHLFGLRIAAMRFFTVFGPAQRPDLAIMKFMDKIVAGDEVPMFGDGSTARDYTYIDDIIEGVLAAERAVSDQQSAISESGRVGLTGFFRIWNLGHSQPVTLSQMIDTIARVVGKPARVKRLPMQPGDVERTWADLTRSAAELNYQPRISLVEGVRQQWMWLRGLKKVGVSAEIS